MPHLTSLHTLAGSRAGYNAIQSFFVETARQFTSLEELRLTFVIPVIPYKGVWPLFWADRLDKAVGSASSLVIDGAGMATMCILKLLKALKAHKQLQRLELRPGSPCFLPDASQLPYVQPPTWMLPPGSPGGARGVLEVQHLQRLAALKQLQHVTFAVDAAAAATAYTALAGLPRLTSLECLGAPLQLAALATLLGAASRLRSLQAGVTGRGSLAQDGLDKRLGALTQLRLRLVSRALSDDLPQLLRLVPHSLTGLSLDACSAWAPDTGALLAQLPSLSLLEVMAAERVEGMPDPGCLVTSLSSLTRLRFTKAPSQPACAPAPQVCPQLQHLHLTGFNMKQLLPTLGPQLLLLRQLSQLTELVLHGEPPICTPLLMGNLPPRLQRLQLSNFTVQWTDERSSGFSASAPPLLEHLSLRSCLMPRLAAPRPTPAHIMPQRGRLRPGQLPPTAPWERLLSGLDRLVSLELVGCRDVVDTHFEAVGRLVALTALSVVAVGNPGVGHGALQHLTGLSRLRHLRWHVGDPLDLPPDPVALGRLRGLMALAVPAWLHQQMQRWHVLDVLDPALPLCDIHVEGPLA